MNIDGLEEGYYNYTLVLFDTSGNSASGTVFVRVVTPIMPTTTTTTTTTGSSGPGEEGPFNLTLIIVSVSILVLLVIIYSISRRRK